MSNYTVTTNFLSKDGLISGNPLKLVKGADLTVEFNNIAVAVNSKIDQGGAVNGTNITAAPTAGVGLAVTGFAGSSPITVAPGAVTDYGLTVLAPAAGNSAVQMQVNAVQQAIVGVAGAAGQLITGSALNDLCIRSLNGTVRIAGALNSSTQIFLAADGGVVIGNATGGSKGAGTINCAGLYVNGVAVTVP